MERLDRPDHLALLEREDSLACLDCPGQKDTVASPDWMVQRDPLAALARKVSKADLVLWAHLVLWVPLAREEREAGRDHLAHLDSVALMELPVHLVFLELLANLGHRAFLVLLAPKVTWERQGLKEALAFKALEVNIEFTIIPRGY